jgi:hypothetical protein
LPGEAAVEGLDGVDVGIGKAVVVAGCEGHERLLDQLQLLLGEAHDLGQLGLGLLQAFLDGLLDGLHDPAFSLLVSSRSPAISERMASSKSRISWRWAKRRLLAALWRSFMSALSSRRTSRRNRSASSLGDGQLSGT